MLPSSTTLSAELLAVVLSLAHPAISTVRSIGTILHEI